MRTSDPEQGVRDDIAARAAAAQQVGAGAPKLNDEDLDMFKLLQGTYNYTTVDHGPDCRSSALRKGEEHPVLTVPKLSA